MNADEPRLIVGVDGAWAALEWALQDARSRRATVQIVHSYGGVHTYGSMSMYGDPADA